MTLARKVPICTAMLVLMWVLFAFLGTSGPSALGFNAGGESELWRVITSGFTGGHIQGMVFATCILVLFAAPAEVTLGSGRFAVVAVATQAVAVPVGITLAVVVEHAGFNRWGADLTSQTFLSPVAWAFGSLAFATSTMGILWRRRLRLVMVALTGTLVLYDGSLSEVVASLAVLLGWAAGALVYGRSGSAWRVSLRESRVLVAALLLAVTAGPALAALTPTSQGPFAEVSQLMWEPAVSPHELAELCLSPSSPECVDAMAINRQSGIGPLVFNLVPLVASLVVALGLVHGRRLAWGLGILITICSIFLIIVQVDGPFGDAYMAINLALVVAPWVAVLVVLLASYRRFTVASDWYRGLMGIGAVLVLCSGVWVAGAVRVRGFVGTPTLAEALAELPSRFLPPILALFTPQYVIPQSSAAWFLYEWVGIAFWAVALVLLQRVLSSPPSPAGALDRHRARLMLMSGTGDHLAWQGLWEGNRYFFHGDHGYVAYRVSHNVAVTLGEPVFLAPATRGEVADAFQAFAAEQGWRVAWYSVTEGFTRPGFHTIHVAEESLLYTDNLEFKGKKYQNIRTARNRAVKEGVSAVWTSWAECDVEMHDKISALSEQWVADKGLPEMGFTLGGLDELRDADTRLLLAVGDDGHLHGVTSWLPVYENGSLAGYTLDFMRRDSHGFRPAIEFLLAEAAVIAAGEGLGWVSLSGAPLSRSDEPTSLLEVLLDKAGGTIEPLYGFRSLAASKYKFHPTHQGWYLAYEDEMNLGSIALGVVSCYLPTMRAGDYVGVVREYLARRAQDRAAEQRPAAESTARP
ncbi:bifunctional lysylphosphatidylglycerol flippase/synthetase MprF [Corynebacterium capitovis]|uniref:bifunctional lysylphosphatidylglycerol flippase/synthetase MprF n=1 Tax=Corynebacterium capitovis TaxID=131081 RepID=UPI0003AABF54|nr:phosphatidylglycerol lysyltransferase domain-containing protein [Corynebacterium capitovis]